MAAILLEHPLDESIGNLLRLENLFVRVDALIPRLHPIDHHFCLLTLLEIAAFEEHHDLSAQILGQLDAHQNRLSAYKGNPHVAESALNELLAQLQTHSIALRAQKNQLQDLISRDEWWFKLRDRMAVPGGSSPVDAPRYFAWQHRDKEDRQEDLRHWLQWFLPLRHSVQFLLKLIRSSTQMSRQVAKGGEFRQNLPQGRCQLIRVWVDSAHKVTPEVQGNQLMATLRFLSRGPRGQTSLCLEDIPFELGLILSH